MKIISKDNKEMFELVDKLFQLGDTPNYLFKENYDGFVFLTDHIFRSEHFFECMSSFMKKNATTDFFYLYSMDALEKETLVFIDSKGGRHELYPNYFEFDIRTDNQKIWEESFIKPFSSNKLLPKFFSHSYLDNLITLIFSTSSDWVIFEKNWSDYAIVGLKSNVIDNFLSSFDDDKITGFKDINELIECWLPVIIKKGTLNTYKEELIKNYSGTIPISYKEERWNGKL